MERSDRPYPLISVEELAEVFFTDPPTLLDIRWSLTGPPGRAAYEQGHLLGAQYVDLETDLADPPGEGGRHPLPDPDRFAAAMRRVGVCRDRPVVVYDQADATSAARAWWLLTHYGHRDVRVLDGGYDRWVAAGGSTTELVASVERGDFVAGPGELAVVDADGAANLASTGTLLDARTAERFRGDSEPVDPVAGHIPGAVSAETTQNVREDGTWKTPEELHGRFVELAADGGDVGVYCGSGVSAAHQVLALRIAGIDAALYPGSWSEWLTDPDRPVATGE